MGSLFLPQPTVITALLRAVVRIVAMLACACTSAPSREADPPRRDEPALAEPVSIRRGGRELLVRCALSCDGARAELTRQQRACVSDPSSTPHAITDAPAMIALGCCTEAEGAYRDACGIEGLEPCVSRWSAECASGRLAP